MKLFTRIACVAAMAGLLPLAAAAPSQFQIAQFNGTITHFGGNSFRAPMWDARFENSDIISSRYFSPKEITRRQEGDTQVWTYRKPELTVEVRLRQEDNATRMTARVTAGNKTITGFFLPGKVRFDHKQVAELYTFIDSVRGIGCRYNEKFFEKFTDRVRLKMTPQGAEAYKVVYGGDAIHTTGAVDNIQVTAAGKAIFPEELCQRLERLAGTVSRPYGKNQTDVVYLQIAGTPMVAGSRLGGNAGGMIYRCASWPETLWGKGAKVDTDLPEAYGYLMAAVAKKHPGNAVKVGFIDLPGAAPRGNGGLLVSQLREQFQKLQIPGKTLQPVYLRSTEETVAALKNGGLALILNPHGEMSPLNMKELPLLVEYVRKGGHWFETGGHSFYYYPHKVERAQYTSNVPGVFADFHHFQFKNSATLGIFAVRKQDYAPWEFMKNRDKALLAMELQLGSDNEGAYLSREFKVYVKPGESRGELETLLVADSGVAQNVQRCCNENGQTVKLSEKIPAPLLEKLRQSILLKFMGSAKATQAALTRLPTPILLHNSDYMKGGFDKQYPDHLPPHPNYGTAAEFREFIDAAHKLGMLYMPYTNPTWWCDEPRGETFLKEGEAPLARDRAGKLIREQYLRNGGYRITLCHPAVRRANKRTLDAFCQDFPADFFFQDQCGARQSRFDFSPAMPYPDAYVETMSSMLREDALRKPLSTEEACFWYMNSETMFCGFESPVPPFKGEQARDIRPKDCWSIYPLMQLFTRDKSTVTLHDLMRGVVTDERLAWVVSWGFQLSYSIHVRDINDAWRTEWIKWLTLLQREFVGPSMGQLPSGFAYEPRLQDTNPADNGTIRVNYGDLQVRANLSDVPREVDGRMLLKHGLELDAPGKRMVQLPGVPGRANSMVAILDNPSGGKQINIYSAPNVKLAIPVGGADRQVRIVAPDGKSDQYAVKNGTVTLSLPGRGLVRTNAAYTLQEL